MRPAPNLPQPAYRLEPGAVFAGDFRLLQPLSSGGMGAVWVALQLSTGKRRALKLIHAEVDSVEARRRFVQEARIGARIASEHVVEVIAAGVEAETDRPFLVMELLEGESLDARVTRGARLSWSEVSEICEQICHGLAAAHDEHIVHRDLKPENVFLARSRAVRRTVHTKILDFGIAKVLSPAASRTGAIGTPLWMAPEQMDETGRITATADVWALGLVAFYMLVGAPYWRVASRPDASLSGLVREVLLDPLSAASERAAALGRPSALPRGFDAWFARCVARSPEDRFPHARQAWEALAVVLAAPPALLPATLPPGALQTRPMAPPGRALAVASSPRSYSAPRPVERTPPLASSSSFAFADDTGPREPVTARRGPRFAFAFAALAALAALALMGGAWKVQPFGARAHVIAAASTEASAEPREVPPPASPAPASSETPAVSAPLPTPAMAPMAAPVDAGVAPARKRVVTRATPKPVENPKVLTAD
jgi:serine/threonine-protein kinase